MMGGVLLLGVLSQYSWLDFATFIMIVDGIVLSIGYALDRFVWARQSDLTKNERRSQREDDGEGRRDYRTLSESASDYSEVVSVDDDFDDDGNPDGFHRPEEEYSPVVSHVEEMMDGAEDVDDLPSQPVTDEEDDLPSQPISDGDEEDVSEDGEMERRNEEAQGVFFSDSEDAEILSDGENFDGSVNNMQYLEEEDQGNIYATTHQDEELTGVSIRQGEEEGVSEVEEGRAVIEENELPDGFMDLAMPKSLSDELEDPADEPEFDNE